MLVHKYQYPPPVFNSRQRFLITQTFTTLSPVTGSLRELKVYKVSIYNSLWLHTQQMGLLQTPIYVCFFLSRCRVLMKLYLRFNNKTNRAKIFFVSYSFFFKWDKNLRKLRIIQFVPWCVIDCMSTRLDKNRLKVAERYLFCHCRSQAVVYFDQLLGAAHSKHWSKLFSMQTKQLF